MRLKDVDVQMSHEGESPDKKIDAIRKSLMEIFPERFAKSAAKEARSFLEAIKTGDLETVRRMIQSNGDLLFIMDDYYGSPVRAATDKNAEIADFLARIGLQRLREGSVPKEERVDAPHALFLRRQKDLRRAEAERAGEGFEAAQNAWKEFVDATSFLASPNADARPTADAP